MEKVIININHNDFKMYRSDSRYFCVQTDARLNTHVFSHSLHLTEQQFQNYGGIPVITDTIGIRIGNTGTGPAGTDIQKSHDSIHGWKFIILFNLHWELIDSCRVIQYC